MGRFHVRPQQHGKMLGAPAAGGRRRRVAAPRARLNAFVSRKRRIHTLKSAAVDVQQVTRMSASPLTMYGSEILGVADTVLHANRTAVVNAAMPAAQGRSIDLSLMLLDGARGTADPAFAAHVLPIKTLAIAYWERWDEPGKLGMWK